MRTLTPEISRHQRLQWLLVAVALLLSGGLVAYLAYYERDLTLSRERERLLTLARVVDDNLTQQLIGANAALTSVRDDLPFLKATGLSTHGSRRLQALTDAMPGVRTMLVTDAEGVVLASNRREIIGLSVTGREYFLSAKSAQGFDTLYVSEPFKTVLGVFSLTFVKTLADDKGGFAGVVAATLDPEYFAVLLGSVLYADEMRSTLVHGKGKVLMAMPPNKATEGMNIAVPGSFFSLHRESGQTATQWSGKVYATGESRMLAFRDVQPVALRMNQPLVLIVSREMGAILAPWRQLASLYGLTYGIVALLLVLGVLLLQKKQAALAVLTMKREEELRDYAEQVNLALAGADLGLWDLDVATGKRNVSARTQEMVGLTPEDPVEDMRAWVKRVHPQDLEASENARRAHESGKSEAFIADYRVRHEQGHWIWIHSRGKVTHRDAHGRALRLAGTYLDISDRKTAEALIADAAFRDPLTHLPNRRLLMDRVSQAQHVSARSGKPCALMFLDLDHFKWVNDTLGHDMGDELLMQVALRLLSCVRQSDTVARFGGDEFVLLFQEIGEATGSISPHVHQLAEKVLDALRQPVLLGDTTYTVTTSMGIALFTGGDERAANLLKRADQAMYLAKASGRNQAHVDASLPPSRPAN